MDDMWENIPIDIRNEIYNLISDKQFINLISCCKYLYFKKYEKKILKEKYKLSKIICVKDKYNFINILYNLKKWDIQAVPKFVERLSFENEFNEDLDNIKNLIFLKEIKLGNFFKKNNLIINLPINFDPINLVEKLISNLISSNHTKNDLEFLLSNSNKIRYYPSIINGMSQIQIRFKLIKSEREKIRNHETLKNNIYFSFYNYILISLYKIDIIFFENLIKQKFWQSNDILKIISNYCKIYNSDEFYGRINNFNKNIDTSKVDQKCIIEFINFFENILINMKKYLRNIKKMYIKKFKNITPDKDDKLTENVKVLFEKIV